MVGLILFGSFLVPAVCPVALKVVPSPVVRLPAAVAIGVPPLVPIALAVALCSPDSGDIGCAAGFGMLLAVVMPVWGGGLGAILRFLLGAQP